MNISSNQTIRKGKQNNPEKERSCLFTISFYILRYVEHGTAEGQAPKLLFNWYLWQFHEYDQFSVIFLFS